MIDQEPRDLVYGLTPVDWRAIEDNMWWLAPLVSKSDNVPAYFRALKEVAITTLAEEFANLDIICNTDVGDSLGNLRNSVQGRAGTLRECCRVAAATRGIALASGNSRDFPS